MSRSRPEDKYALVVGLKERGNVVAVTGDGNKIYNINILIRD